MLFSQSRNISHSCTESEEMFEWKVSEVQVDHPVRERMSGIENLTFPSRRKTF